MTVEQIYMLIDDGEPVRVTQALNWEQMRIVFRGRMKDIPADLMHKSIEKIYMRNAIINIEIEREC